MADKFILAGLHDSKSKEIAEILGNPTARKILDYLSESDASESGIAETLKLPLSTVHYNIQKLLRNRIVEIKDYFWSEKGNKINIYKVARKLIVIAPKYARGYEALKSIIPAILFGAVLIFAVSLIFNNIKISSDIGSQISGQEKLKRFTSPGEIKNFIKQNSNEVYRFSAGMAESNGIGPIASKGVQAGGTAERSSAEDTPSDLAGSSDYSQTNIQVHGVDEADIVKNDGKYIYAVSGRNIVIIDAFPAENSEIVSEINLSGNIHEIFVNENRLIVFGAEQNNLYPVPLKDGTVGVAIKAMPEIGIMPSGYSNPESFVRVYDITDRTAPLLDKNISVNGNYFESRMIGNYVYFIINQPIYRYDNIIMPRILEGEIVRDTLASEVYYFDIPDESYIFSTINSLNLDNGEISGKTFMMGYTQNMYVSNDNIYITYPKRISNRYYYDKLIDIYSASVPGIISSKIEEVKDSDMNYYEKIQKAGEILQAYSETLETDNRLSFQNNIQDKTERLHMEISRETGKTVIHRISIDKDSIEHKAEGEVPGSILNQFSMDEHNDYFRTATTTESWRTGEASENNIYVLNMGLEVIGKIENLAEGERIYSARFIQDRAYIVTFRQVDPLFVIDLKNAKEPKVLGYLKIPGVSDYLHPYDENHIIGVGRDSSEDGGITGMKLSLFDIIDFENPKELSKYLIGGRGTYSEALTDHKAFLFSKEKNLLVIPVTIYEEWNYKFNGADVFSVDLQNGFQLRGSITHENESEKKTEYYYPDWQSTIRRSLYIEDTLYTISANLIKMNRLDDLAEIKNIKLPYWPEKKIISF